MIVVLKPEATEAQVADIVLRLEEKKLQSRVVKGAERSVIAVIGSVHVDPKEFEDLPGVAEVTRISRPYKLASREAHPEDTVVKVRDVSIGGPRLVVMAGPCAVESREQLLTAARECHAAGATILRGGAFKPRTSPYAFQGLGEEGLRYLAEARDRYGMPVVTEVVSPSQVELVAKYADIVQIGARNMQNFELLKAVSEIDRPVLLKRGLAATIEEWLMAAEYILAGGNPNVILCERGIRTYETSTRNTLDLSAIPVLHALTHLPLIVDPSHGTGNRGYCPPMALAAVAAGADGIMLEVHPDPPRALSDGPQSLYPKQLARLMRDVEAISPVVGRQLHRYHAATADPTRWAAAKQTVAFQGEAGAFSERACRHFFGESARAIPQQSFRDVFEAVAHGRTAHGVLPIENSLTGSIHPMYDLLLEYDVRIVGEIKLRIVHNLIALPGTRVEDVRTIYAHPQAAAQCEDYLRQHPEWSVSYTYDTAGSVSHVRREGLADAAAIASPEAAALHDMEILKESIESNPSNYTRFIIIGTGGNDPATGDKTTVVFTVENRAGALLAVLDAISRHGINMLKLESRPIPGKPWEYMFYADLQISATAEEWGPALKDASSHAASFRVLGSYAAAG